MGVLLVIPKGFSKILKSTHIRCRAVFGLPLKKPNRRNRLDCPQKKPNRRNRLDCGGVSRRGKFIFLQLNHAGDGRHCIWNSEIGKKLYSVQPECVPSGSPYL
ncbi:MAG: hypothetical protein JKY32_08665 [Rhizobiales bacterium]|nr:hypothetical protein [Hyphomicrobiales bacterium]